jgi:hypothetical protein
MIDLESIQNWIVFELWKYTGGSLDPTTGAIVTQGTPIVPQNSMAPRPPYPFVTYNWIVPYIPEPGQPSLTGAVVEDEEETEWYQETRHEQPTVVLSLSAYSNDPAECITTLRQAWRFFEFDRRDELSAYGLVIADVSAVQDRTMLLDGGGYEYRYGIDVRMRTTSTITRTIDLIERVEINGEEVALG